MKLLDELPRPAASILTQLRTQHVPLNDYLHRISASESPLCEACGEENETLIHYLLRCPAHERARLPIRHRFGASASDIAFLLNNRDAVAMLLAYTRRTNRFHATHGRIPDPDPRED
ncbi:hypothetical protein FISHEDRAFT_47353 [Fistulina hepatica ATCC 64428]|uniref:Reverse transcriptase zinc-binding domain-containing protein n=1 Tax=Fistulina hepatica ATCC 64428 TaxID=1128425 RepID=A0A0D7A7Q4_9AGAR|nr:hypothetical protein FISHEDRAFT_47353 [Fistulina hepatica ATCC 64428]